MPLPPIGSLWTTSPNSQEVFAYTSQPPNLNHVISLTPHHSILVTHIQTHNTSNPSRCFVEVVIFPEATKAEIFSPNFNSHLQPISSNESTIPPEGDQTIPPNHTPHTPNSLPQPKRALFPK